MKNLIKVVFCLALVTATGTYINCGSVENQGAEGPVAVEEGAVPFLSIGTSHKDVEKLESFLKEQGYFKASADTLFEKDTEQAVKLWQKDLGLEPTGKFDYNWTASSKESDVEGKSVTNFLSDEQIAACYADLTADGVVNVNDFLMLNSYYGQSYPGSDAYVYDVVFDGVVDVNDFLALNTYYGTVVEDCPFVSIWLTQQFDTDITLPVVNDVTNFSEYNANVDWGDGNQLTPSTSVISSLQDVFEGATHDYESVGYQRITIHGTFPTMTFSAPGPPYYYDAGKLLAITNLGNVGWESFEGTFYGCSNLTIVKGGNTSGVTNMKSMFDGAQQVTPETSNWDVSNVTNMERAFSGAMHANPNVSGWNVSEVVNMNGMFLGAQVANPNVHAWDVSNVTTMDGMFNGALLADPDMGNWTFSSISAMDFMFVDNPSFSTSNYSAMLMALQATATQSDVTLHAQYTYFNQSAVSARDYLINTLNWTIVDSGLEP